jgi:RhtB (resistance to homoserine/threonine) family protein
MALFFSLVGLLLVHLLAVASPGPAFFNVSRHSLRSSRRSALACAGGTAAAAIFWALAATFGLAALLSQAAWLYQTLKLIGGCYLIWLGIQSWRQTGSPVPEGLSGHEPDYPPLTAFWQGFSANLANPKIVVFFSSIFVSFLDPTGPAWFRGVALFGVACNEIVWYSLVAVVFSNATVQSHYRRAKSAPDRVAGSVMAAFGLKLVWDARS